MKTYNVSFTGAHRGRGEAPMKIVTHIAAHDEHEAAIALQSNYEAIADLNIVEIKPESED